MIATAVDGLVPHIELVPEDEKDEKVLKDMRQQAFAPGWCLQMAKSLQDKSITLVPLKKPIR